MKRYLVFAFRDYYPSGGMNDLFGHYDIIEDIKKGIEAVINEDDGRYNINVLDTKTMKYTDTYDMLDYSSKQDEYNLDKDELNNLINELLSFNNII